MRKTLILSAAMLAMAPLTANAVLIVDTGTSGVIDPNTNWSLDSGQFLAGEFTIFDAATISSIEGWIGFSNLGSLSTVIYGESAGLPGAELFSGAFTSTGGESWQGLAGLSWDLLAGTYFVAFEVRGGQTFTGSLPDTALSRLNGYAFNEGSGSSWVAFDLGSAFRINATTSVPEPGTLALLGIGLAALGMTRRRRKV